MPLGMGTSDLWGKPQGGYIMVGGAPKQLPPHWVKGLGKYPWLYGDPPPRQMSPTNQMGPQTDDFGFAIGQKSRSAAPGTSVVWRTAGPGKGQNNNLFGQPFKGGIF